MYRWKGRAGYYASHVSPPSKKHLRCVAKEAPAVGDDEVGEGVLCLDYNAPVHLAMARLRSVCGVLTVKQDGKNVGCFHWLNVWGKYRFRISKSTTKLYSWSRWLLFLIHKVIGPVSENRGTLGIQRDPPRIVKMIRPATQDARESGQSAQKAADERNTKRQANLCEVPPTSERMIITSRKVDAEENERITVCAIEGQARSIRNRWTPRKQPPPHT